MMKCEGYTVLRYLAALAVAIPILAPMLWLSLMSVSTTTGLTRVPLEWPPRQWDFGCHGHLLSLTPDESGTLFLPALGSSLLVAVRATLVSLLLAIPAAFSFSCYPGRDGWLYAGPGIYIVSSMAFVPPLYPILEHFGLLNTHNGLVLVYYLLIVPFLVWAVKSQFDTLPQDIGQAARLDGLRIWQTLLCITLPLVKPMLGATTLFGWLLAWGEFFRALLFASNLAAQTLSVTIAGFTVDCATDDGLVMAVGILASVLPLLIVTWLQESLVSGLTSKGSKG